MDEAAIMGWRLPLGARNGAQGEVLQPHEQ